MKKFIYLVSTNSVTGRDDYYDAIVVIATNENEAEEYALETCDNFIEGDNTIKKIGKANKNQKVGFVLASFNAG
jgi:hypothetical protein